MTPKLLSVDEAAGRLGVGRTVLYELMGRAPEAPDYLESVRIGRRRLIPAEAVEDLVGRLRSGVERADHDF